MTDRAIVEAVKKEFREALFAALGRFPEAATPNDRYLALALAVRRQVMRRWVATSETYYKKASRTVCYLSAEFLLGPHLGNNLLNLGLQEEARQAMSELGYDLDDHPGPGGGARPRQRGARAAGRLLHGLARDARDPHARLRDPLRVRDLRPADPRRVAGREDRQVAGPRQPLGDPPAGDRRRRVPRRAHRGLPGRAGPLPRALGAGARRARGRLRRADPRLPERHREPPAPLEGGGHRVLRLRGLQPGGLLAGGGPEGGLREHHQGPLPERRAREGQAGCASSSSTSSCPARCRT